MCTIGQHNQRDGYRLDRETRPHQEVGVGGACLAEGVATVHTEPHQLAPLEGRQIAFAAASLGQLQ